MPAGFRKGRAGSTPPQVNKPNGKTGSGPHKESGRENKRGGANYESGGKRDFAERIYRDRRS